MKTEKNPNRNERIISAHHWLRPNSASALMAYNRRRFHGLPARSGRLRIGVICSTS